MFGWFQWQSFLVGIIFAMFIWPMFSGMLRGKAKSVQTA